MDAFLPFLANIDPTVLGIDSGIALSIVGISGRITDWLKEIRWHGKLERLYFFVPFVASLSVAALQHTFQDWGGILKDTIFYGAYSTMLLHGYKKVGQGK